MRPLTLIGEFSLSIPALPDGQINAGHRQRCQGVTMPAGTGGVIVSQLVV
jgi:hypothetical protein